MHNEDDSSEAGVSEPQPCTSATAQPGTSGQDQSQSQVSPTPVPVAGEASGVRTQGEAVDTAPPPYASIDLGANAAAPPGTNLTLIAHRVWSDCSSVVTVWSVCSFESL